MRFAVLRITALAACLGLSLSLGGCGLLVGHVVREVSKQREQQAEVVASLARFRRLVVEARPELLAHMFTVDGQLAQGDAPALVGRAAIDAFYSRAAAAGKVQDYVLAASATAVDDQTATQQGRYSQTLVAPGTGPLKSAGHFEISWRHQADGRWLITRLHTVATADTPG